MDVRELDHKESWVPKKWCFWTVVLEKTLESPLDCKEIQPVHPKGNQSWIFIGRSDVEAKPHYFGHLMWRPDSFEKTLMLGKIEGRRRKGQQRMRWHHWLNGHEFEQASGVGDGQRSMVCCSPWDHKQLDVTEWLSGTEGRPARLKIQVSIAISVLHLKSAGWASCRLETQAKFPCCNSEAEFLFYETWVFAFRPSTYWVRPTDTVKANLLNYGQLIVKVNHIQKYRHSNIYTSVWPNNYILTKWTHRINHYPGENSD